MCRSAPDSTGASSATELEHLKLNLWLAKNNRAVIVVY